MGALKKVFRRIGGRIKVFTVDSSKLSSKELGKSTAIKKAIVKNIEKLSIINKIKNKSFFHGTIERGINKLKFNNELLGKNESSKIGIWTTDDRLVAKNFASSDVVEYFHKKKHTLTKKDQIEFQRFNPKGGGWVRHWKDKYKKPFIKKDLSQNPPRFNKEKGFDTHYREKDYFGQIMKLKVSVKNPYIINSKKYKSSYSDKLKTRDSFEVMMDKRDKFIPKSIGPKLNGGSSSWDGRMMKPSGVDEKMTKDFMESIRKKGYDSIYIKDTVYDSGPKGKSDQLIVFDDNNLKKISSYYGKNRKKGFLNKKLRNKR
jgi:hypothetical protein